jgi:hypothetical protein
VTAVNLQQRLLLPAASPSSKHPSAYSADITWLTLGDLVARRGDRGTGSKGRSRVGLIWAKWRCCDAGKGAPSAVSQQLGAVVKYATWGFCSAGKQLLTAARSTPVSMLPATASSTLLLAMIVSCCVVQATTAG